MRHLLEPFRKHLETRNFSPKSIHDYLWSLGKFLGFLEEYGIESAHDVTAEIIRDYRAWRHRYRNRYGRQDAPKTQNNHLAAVKLFFKYLHDSGLIPSDPAGGLEYVREPKTLPHVVLNNQEVKKLLRQCDTNTILGYRDRALLELLYSTGIRRSELINLKPGDVNPEEGFVRVNAGKGNKDRVVPLGRIACKYVENYIKGIRPLIFKAKDCENLFVSKKGGRLERSAVARIIDIYAGRAKLGKKVSPHTFRRSCATEMIRNKAQLYHVKEMLGHESIESVKRYCSLSIVDLKEAHKKYHPRERDLS